jgi:hypothetical protein
MTAQLLSFNSYYAKQPVVATSSYLNQPIRTEQQVIDLRAARQRAEPRAERPCDQEDMPA